MFIVNFIRKIYSKTYLFDIVFLFILILSFFYFGYHDVFFSEPFGIHYMRQTDSLSFASNYFNNGFKFFSPELYNLESFKGKAACEFPVTYYITSLMYSIFGKHFFIQRIVHLLITYFGVFTIYRLALLILNDKIYAFLVGLAVFTSTIFNYYAFNYLPDIPALGFMFAGWYFFYKYLNDKKKASLIFMFLFFTLGSLIKVTYLINVLAVITFCLIFIFIKASLSVKSLKKVTWIGLLTILIVGAWNVYMLYYNELNGSTLFNTKPLPIWDMAKQDVAFVWELMTNYWYKQYFPKSTFHLFYAIFFLQIIFIKKSSNEHSLIIFILFFANLSYLLLFFRQFRDHDYYFLAFFPLFLLVLINGIKTLQKIISKRFIHYIIQAIILVIIVSGLKFSRIRVYKRFDKKMDMYSQAGLLIHENRDKIKELNIGKTSKVIVAPDYCLNAGLFFLDRKGWNLPKDHIKIENINNLKNKGADYLLLATEDKDILAKGDSTGMRIFEGKEIYIFKLSLE